MIQQETTATRPSHGPIARIDLAALLHNFQHCRDLNPGQPAMPVVKANAYGHGAVEVASALLNAGADAVCVARLDEALTLRNAGIRGDIVILEGVYNTDELSQAQQHRLTLVLHDAAQIHALPDSSVGTPQRVWLKLETGMHRLGAPLSDAKLLATELEKKQWCKDIGWFTHLACADEIGNAAAQQQINAIQSLAENSKTPVSFANAAAACAWPGEGYIRPGIAVYGASPLLNKSAAELGLKPVMTLETQLLAVKDIPSGAPVGYGGTWRAERDSRIGIAAIGYGDGYPRCLSSSSNKAATEVSIAGQRYPVIGRVSMDKITLDLTNAPNDIVAGATVQLWGNEILIDEVAAQAETISYELLCGVTHRVPRHY